MDQNFEFYKRKGSFYAMFNPKLNQNNFATELVNFDSEGEEADSKNDLEDYIKKYTLETNNKTTSNKRVLIGENKEEKENKVSESINLKDFKSNKDLQELNSKVEEINDESVDVSKTKSIMFSVKQETFKEH